jgi:hypothetical protein
MLEASLSGIGFEDATREPPATHSAFSSARFDRCGANEAPPSDTIPPDAKSAPCKHVEFAEIGAKDLIPASPIICKKHRPGREVRLAMLGPRAATLTFPTLVSLRCRFPRVEERSEVQEPRPSDIHNHSRIQRDAACLGQRGWTSWKRAFQLLGCGAGLASQACFSAMLSLQRGATSSEGLRWRAAPLDSTSMPPSFVILDKCSPRGASESLPLIPKSTIMCFVLSIVRELHASTCFPPTRHSTTCQLDPTCVVLRTQLLIAWSIGCTQPTTNQPKQQHQATNTTNDHTRQPSKERT